MSYNAGTVFLQVVPSYDNFQRSLRQQAVAAGKAFEKDFGDEAGNAVSRAIDKSGPAVKKASEKLGDDAGKAVGGRMHQQIQSSLDKAIRSLPKVIIDADTKKADREIAVLRGRLEEIRDAHVKFDLDSGAAQAQIAQVAGELEAVHRMAERGSDLDIDTAGAMASLIAVDALVKEATRDRTANVKVDVDRSKLDSLMAGVRNLTGSGDEAANSFRAFNAVLLAAVAIGPMLIPILGGIAGGLAAMLPILGAVGGGLGVVILGLSGIPGAVSAMNDAQKAAAKDAVTQGKTMQGAANGVRDAEIALTRARQDAARQQADAARRVADARRSLADAERSAADSIENALEREQQARQNLADVTRRTNRAVEAAERSLADAEKNLTRARDDAARRNAAAAQTISRAEGRVVETQQAATKAQQDLVDARQRAQDQLEDLAMAAEGGALAEREAVLAVADAKKEYDRVMGREFKSARSVEEVTLAYQEAQLQLKRVQTQNQRTAEELADANAKGVEGSDLVTEAQARLTDAQQAQVDAAAAVAQAYADAEQVRLDGIERVDDAIQARKDAQLDLTQTEADGARAIRDAQHDIADAVENVRDVRLAASRDIAAAERNVADAVRDQGRAAVDSSQSIADANRRLADAQVAYQTALTQTAVIGSAAQQTLAQEMGKLSPAGQDFARFIFGLKDEFLGLRHIAEEGLLPGLQDFLQMIIKTYGPGFTKWVGAMAEVAGDLFRQLGKVMTSNPAWKEFFAAFGKLSPKLFREFGEATINWATVFIALLDAFLPLAEMASGWLLKLSEKAAAWATNLEDTKGFQGFMEWLERILPKVGEFFAAFWSAVQNLVVAMAPFAEFLLELFTGILGVIGKIPPGLLAAIVGGFIGLTLAVQGTLAIMTLIMSSFTIFASATSVWIFAILAVIAAFVLLYSNVEWFRDAVNLALDVLKVAFQKTFEAIGIAATWLWENALKPAWENIKEGWRVLASWMAEAWARWGKPTWDAIETAANWLWDHVLSPVFGFIGDHWRQLANGIKWVWDNIWYPVIDLITTIIWNLWKLELKLAFEAISGGFSALGTAIKWVWDNVLVPVFGFFADTLHGKEGLTWVFEQAVGAIKTIWEGLKDIAKAPIKFIVETVINGGLIGTFNKIADFFGTKQMKEIPLPQGFATGGYTGPGGRYEPAGIVHRDEYVISSPARRTFEAQNPGVLDYLNATGRLPGYATGGRVVKPVKGPYGLPFGNTYSDGSFHSGQDFPVPTGTGVVAAIAGVVSKVLHLADSYGNHVVLKHPGGAETLYAHLSSTLGTHVGEVVGAGTPLGLSGATGHVTGPHLHFEFRTPPGGYGNAVNPLGILSGAVDPSGDGGFFPDWLAHPFSYLKGKVTDALGKMGDNPYVQLISAMPMSLLGLAKDSITGLAKGVLGKAGDVASGAWDFINGPFGGAGTGPFPDNGAAMYDNGGYLPPGLTTVLNATGKPEPVFTSAQWDSLQNGAGQGGGPTLQTGDLYAVDPDAMVSKIRTAQKDAAAVNNLASIASGAGL